MPFNRLIAPGGLMISGLAAAESLGDQQRENERQQYAGKLCGGHPVAHGSPASVNAGGKCGDAEMRHGAEIRQGFHQGKRHADNQRRPGHGHGDAGKGAPGVTPQGARHL